MTDTGAVAKGLEMKLNQAGAEHNGLARWLLAKVRRDNVPAPRLALVERITLAPRQTLALVEAEGRRFLIATSPESAPTFYSLEDQGRKRIAGRGPGAASTRVSW